MELSIVEYLVIMAMRGNGKTANELIENLGERERDEAIECLEIMPLKIKIILRKLGVTDFDVYEAEENFFDKIDKLVKEIENISRK